MSVQNLAYYAQHFQNPGNKDDFPERRGNVMEVNI